MLHKYTRTKQAHLHARVREEKLSRGEGAKKQETKKCSSNRPDTSLPNHALFNHRTIMAANNVTSPPERVLPPPPPPPPLISLYSLSGREKQSQYLCTLPEKQRMCLVFSRKLAQYRTSVASLHHREKLSFHAAVGGPANPDPLTDVHSDRLPPV